MAVNRKRFKDFERYVAKKLGGQRISVSEQSKREKTGDISHPRFFVECRIRKKLALLSWWTQVVKDAKITGKMPLAVFSNDKLQDVTCLIKLKDLKNILEEKNR